MNIVDNERKAQIARLSEENADTALALFQKVKLGKSSNETSTITVQKADVPDSSFAGVVAQVHTQKSLADVMKVLENVMLLRENAAFVVEKTEIVQLDDKNQLYRVMMGSKMADVEELGTRCVRVQNGETIIIQRAIALDEFPLTRRATGLQANIFWLKETDSGVDVKYFYHANTVGAPALILNAGVKKRALVLKHLE